MSERIVSPGIVVDPDRHSGDPCIANRRIPAEMVVGYALDGARRTLIDDYGKPLEVRWLCRWCHHAEHPENVSD